jgi:methyl-accepting chemotaxis protein
VESGIKKAIHEEAEGGKLIVSGIASIRDATNEIEKGSRTLLEGNEDIKKAMVKAEMITEQVKTASASIAGSAMELNEQITKTSKLLVENDENIGVIEKRLSIFKTK